MNRTTFRNDSKPLDRLIQNKYFWAGLVVIGLTGAVLYTVFNSFLMPAYTRHGSTISVPDVIDRTVSDADSILRQAGLTTEQVLLRKSNVERGIILDQNPAPFASVKPGRRIYLTVNAGDTTTVIVPDVEAVSLREAQNRILSRGLAVAEALPDSFPSPHVKTVTRQLPEAGRRVIPGSEVQLWISMGLGENQVLVPSVTGMSASEARERLREVLLNSVLITTEQDTLKDPVILDQSPSPGTSVREGIVVRLRTSRD